MAQLGHVKIDLHPYYDTKCWGCGSQLVPSSLHVFLKCTWCGAITDQNQHMNKVDNINISKLRQLWDCSLVTSSLLFMLCVICSGVWALLPVVSSFGYACRIFHCIVTATLSIITLSSFYLSSTTSAGEPSNVPWGEHMLVGRDDLSYYSFCSCCSKPKPPGTHHCNSCNKCVSDRHSHCEFIGNCIGAGNYRHFISLLISVIVSCSYIAIMSSYGACHQWPDLDMRRIIAKAIFSQKDATEVLAEIIFGFAGPAFSSLRINVLVFLLLMCLIIGANATGFLFEQVLDLGFDGNTIINQIISSYSDLCSRASRKLSHIIGCHQSSFRIVHCSKYGKR